MSFDEDARKSLLAGVGKLSRAVGSTLDFTLGELEQTMILHWDDAGWTVAASPNQGASSNLLLGVSAPGSGAVAAC